jgi:IS5 family transposase
MLEVPAYDAYLYFGVGLLRVAPERQSCLLESLLPGGLALLSDELAAIDALLADGEVYASVWELWRAHDRRHGTSALTEGRPTIPIETFVRLMVVKARHGWGYERLVREVADSLHLRRFCEIGLAGRVPDESTLRKLCQRLGAATVEAIVLEVIARSAAQTGFRPRAARVDSTVVEADVRFPTDAGLAADGVVLLARAGARLRDLAGPRAPRVRDRGRGAKGSPAQARAHAQAAHREGQGRDPEDHRRLRRIAAQVGARSAPPGVLFGGRQRGPAGGRAGARAADRPLRARA